MDGLITIVLIVAGALILYRYTRGCFTHRQSGLPKVKSHPLLGSALVLDIDNLPQQLSLLARKLGSMFEFRILGMDTVVLNTSELINKALCQENNKELFNDRPYIYIADRIIGRYSIILRNADEVHSKLRKYFVQGLHTYGDGILAFENIVKTELRRVIDHIQEQSGNEFEVVGLVNKSFSNVITILKTWSPGKIRGIVDWYLEEQRKEIDEGKEQLLTDRMIKCTIIDIIAAGVFTTSSVLLSAILCLIHHKNYQEKIQAELDNAIGRTREPSISDRNNCHFLQATIMEILRLVPPAPFGGPHSVAKDTVFEGYFVAKGTQILGNIWHIQHDENIWGEPWTFRPERFLDSEGKLKPSSDAIMKGWLPFGTGRRKCPGMTLASTRLFLYLAFMLQRWTFLPAPGKCGSFDPREGAFDFKFLAKPKPFYCIAKSRT